MDIQKNNSNTGIVIAVLCLVIGVVLGAVVVNTKSVAPSQEGAAIKSSTTRTIKTNPFTPAQLEAQKKIKAKVIYQNTPEEINAAFGVDPKTSMRRLLPNFSEPLNQVFGGNPSGVPYYEGCIGQDAYVGEWYDFSGGTGHGYYINIGPCFGA